MKTYMFGLSDLQRARPTAFGLDTDRGYYYVVLAVVVASIAVVLTLERTRLGRLLRAVADSPLALTTIGTSVNVTRVLVFCMSAFLAGLSAAQFGSANANKLQLRPVARRPGRARRLRPQHAARLDRAPLLLFIVPGYIDNPTAANVLQLLFGLGAMVAELSSIGPNVGRLLGAEPDCVARQSTTAVRLARRTHHILAPAPLVITGIDEAGSRTPAVMESLGTSSPTWIGPAECAKVFMNGRPLLPLWLRPRQRG